MYGGLGLKDMATEQLVNTTHKLAGHIRAQTSVGITFLITVDAYQLYLGTTKPFFQMNPERFPHRQAKSHSKLTYLWETMQSLNITLMMAEQRTPQLKFENDAAIIDTILQTQQENAGSSKFISNQCIVYANACCLWLCVTLLSDITKDDRNLINPIYFHGNHQHCTSIEYPYQPKPPPRRGRHGNLSYVNVSSQVRTLLHRPYHKNHKQKSQKSVINKNLIKIFS